MQDLLDKIRHDHLAFTSIFDSITDLVFFMEADKNSFRYIYINQSALKIMNIKENTVGKRIENVVPKGQSSLLISRYQEAQSTQKPVSFIQILETENGEFIGETSLNPILTEDGECKYVLGIVRDITERKEKEKELNKTKRILERNQKRLNSLVENNGDAVYELDLEGKIIQVNQMVTQITGYQEEQLIGNSFIPLIVENCLTDTIYHFNKALNGSKEEYETWITNSKGQQIHLFVKNVPIIIDGLLVGVYGIAKDITEQKKLERLLKESEERYRKVVEYSPKGIVIHRDGIILYANPFALKLVREENLTGKSVYSYLHSKYHDISKQRLSEAKVGKELPFIEMKLNRKDGEVLDVELAGVPINFEGGPAILVVIRDVTDRKRVETALRQSVEKYRLITENMTDLVGALDENGRVIYASPSHEFVLGLPPEVYEGSLAFDLVHPEDSPNLRQQFNYMVRTKENIKEEARVKHADGKWIWTEISGNPVYNENGKLHYFLLVARDISDRKRTEEALLVSEERYRLIADNSLDLIQLANLDGIVTYASPSHKKILGFEPDEYIGQMVLYLPNGKVDDTFNKAMFSMAGNRKPFHLEIQREHKSGFDVWLDVTGTPVYERNGQLKYWMLVAREMTERKKHEKQLEYLSNHDTLTGLPNRRLFKEQLKQSIKEAERYQRRPALMFLDLDRFKYVNDTFGHDVGDELLRQFTERVTNCIRESDLLVRLGGDEFVILFPEFGCETQIEMIAERIIHSVQKPWKIFEHEIITTSSIGIALYEKGDSEKELLTKADVALYQTKADGRNAYCVYYKIAKGKK